MIDAVEQIGKLEVAISSQESTVAHLKAEIAELECELDSFQVRYNQIVRPMVERLEAARAVVAEMEQYYRHEQFNVVSAFSPQRRRCALAEEAKPGPAKRASSLDSPNGTPQAAANLPTDTHQPRLKRLYDQIIGYFHPDLAADEEERVSRNWLLALVNEAYSERDLVTLEALATLSGIDKSQPDRQRPTSTVQLGHVLRAYQLERTYAELGAHIERLTQERDALRHGELANLKTKAKFAQQQNRDLLREIAASVENEYQDYMVRLDRLRSRPGATRFDESPTGADVSAPVGPTLSLYLSVAGQDQEIVTRMKPGERIILGRTDTVASELFIDLTAYDAHELGVSREHAEIEYRGHENDSPDVWVTDLGSANGTYLNERRLTFEAHPLSDSDEIRLGRLRIDVRYDPTVALFLEKIRLYNPSSDASWTSNQQTWVEALRLALSYGWGPISGATDAPYHSAVDINEADAHGLADSLERALLDLGDEPPKVLARRLDSPRIEPPIWYFNGQAGKQKIHDLIVFCRQGTFKIERD